jgi:hypothetical protein
LIYDTTAPGSPFGSETLYHNDSTAFSFDVTIDGIAFQSSADPFGQFPVQDSTYQWDELRPSIPGNFSLAATGILLLAATWAFASRRRGFTS